MSIRRFRVIRGKLLPVEFAGRAAYTSARSLKRLVRGGSRMGVFLMSWLPVIFLGFVFGLQHALDGDHIAAVSTIVSEHRSVKKSSLVGALWGLGHTASLLLAGIAVIVLKISVSDSVAQGLEFSVGVMLVALGISTLRKLFGRHRVHVHAHEHDGATHTHLHIHSTEGSDLHIHSHTSVGPRPFLVGIVHGLAGSAALMLLVLSTIPSPALGLLYIAVFGAGSIGGMLAMSAVIGLPFALTANRFDGLSRRLRIAAGAFSVVFGVLVSANIAAAWMR